MSLLAALNLPTRNPPVPALAKPEDDDELARVKAVVGEKMKTAVQLVKGVADPKQKVALAQALEAAEKQRLASAKLTDAAARVETMRQVEARIQKTIDAMLPRDVQERHAASLARELAKELQPKLVADRKTAVEAYGVASKAAEEADAAAKAAKGDAKKAADMHKAAADKQLATAQKRLKQIDDDLTAIGSTSTSAEAAQQILARNGGAGTLKSSDIITVAPSGLQRGSTVQTSGELVNGSSKTTATTTSRSAGIGTVTDKSETVNTEVKGDRKTTTTDSRSTKIGIDLAPSTEKTTKKEHEKDGKTTGVENKTSTAASVSEGTATHSSSTTVTRSDGSSTATTTSGGVERGDGKAGGNVSRARTATEADGKETKTSGTGKAGLVAGKDGIGGYGDGEIGREQKTPGGMKTGTVIGASANIVCNVVKDESCDPPMYELTLTVDFGVRVGKSLAGDKEPEKGKPDEETRATGKVSVGGSQKVVMERKTRLDENAARAYVAGLKTGNGTQAEFGIIRCGMQNGWAQARDMYLGLTKDVTSQAVADRLEKGGSLKVGGEQKLSLGGEAGTKGGTIGGGASVNVDHGHDGSVTVSKDQEGNVAYDAKQGDSNKLTGGVKVSAGAVEGSFSMGHEWKTSTGYKIAIPKDATKAEADAMRKALAACKSQAELDAFAKNYPKAVQETTKVTGNADTQEVSVAAGKVAKVGMKFGSGVEEETTKDAQGNVRKKTTGTSEGGMDVTVLGRKIGDSSKQTATSTTDAQGRSRTDIVQDDTTTDTVKLLASMPGSGEGGVLSKVTGGADTDSKTSTGLGLDDATLKRLGLMALEDWNGWMHAPVNGDDRKDWAVAGRHIQKAKGTTASVSKALAEFVGGNPRQRMQVIEDTVRGSRGTGGGDAWEFGGELAKFKPDFDRVVIAASEETVTEVAKEPAKAKEVADKLLATLETLHRAVGHEPNFKSAARRAEMLAAIEKRRAKVRLALKQANAAGPVTAPSLDEQKQRYNDLLSNCRNYQEDEKKLFQKVQDELESLLGGSAVTNQKLVAELQALYKVWDPEYEEMATLAQTCGLGENIYWRYRPDRDRFKLAHDNKKPFGEAAGKKKETEKEKADRYASKLAKDEKNRVPDPNAKSDDQMRAERKQQDDDRIKRGTAIQNELPGASRATEGRGMALYKCVGRQEKYDAVEAFNAGKKLWDEGEALRKQIHKDHMPELVDLGPKALAKYKAADAHFDKGLAMYPKDWRK